MGTARQAIFIVLELCWSVQSWNRNAAVIAPVTTVPSMGGGSSVDKQKASTPAKSAAKRQRFQVQLKQRKDKLGMKLVPNENGTGAVVAQVSSESTQVTIIKSGFHLVSIDQQSCTHEDHDVILASLRDGVRPKLIEFIAGSAASISIKGPVVSASRSPSADIDYEGFKSPGGKAAFIAPKGANKASHPDTSPDFSQYKSPGGKKSFITPGMPAAADSDSDESSDDEGVIVQPKR